jgi:Transcriptional regulatory protein, C terminal/GAF domain
MRTFSGNRISPAHAHSGVKGAAEFSPLLRSLQTAASELARPLTVQQIAEVAAVAGTRAVAAAAAVVAVETQDGGLRRVHDIGLSMQARERLSFLTADAPGLIARAAHAPEPTFLRSLGDAFARFSSVPTIPAVLGTGALAALPLTHDGRRLGVIILAWSRDRQFSADDRAFLTTLAAHCSLALALALDRGESRSAERWVLGDMEIDPIGNRVLIGGRPVHLTPSEFQLLVLLADEPGRCRSRKEILRHLWQTDYVGDERACDAHLANLRKKIERDPSRPERLLTVRGRGYALRVLDLPAEPRP